MLLIAYKPYSECYHGGSLCNTYFSDFIHLETEDIEEIIKQLIIVFADTLLCCEKPYEVYLHNCDSEYIISEAKRRSEQIIQQRIQDAILERQRKDQERKDSIKEQRRKKYEELKREFE